MSETEFVPGFGDIGARLRAARERSGMSVAQVAERMHCDRGLVETLEAGRFSQLGAPVFARGHIRRYAELLGEPVGELLERWDRDAAGHVAAPDLTRIPQAKRPPNTRRLLWPLGVLAVVILFGVLISWVLRDSPLPALGGFDSAVPTAPVEASASPPAEAPMPASSVDADAVAGSEAATVGVPAVPAPVAAAPAMAAAVPATGAAPPVSAPAAANTTPPALRLRARADCWVEIYDADRKRLYFDLLKAGASTSVRGPAPLRVLLGNVAGVSVEFNGRPLELPRAVRRANTANVLVAADGTVGAVTRAP